MVLRSKSVGEQDVADQQGVFFMPKDLTDVRSFFVTYVLVGVIIFENRIKIFIKNTYLLCILFFNIITIFS